MKYANLPPDKQIGQYQWNHQAHLGSGAFGTVFLGKDSKKNSMVAIKQLDQNQIKQSGMQDFVKKEIEILKILKSNNNVGLIDFLQSSSRFYIVQLFCNGGDLRHYLEKKGKIPEQEAKSIFTQMLAGYQELIQHKLVHRDLKPDNVLIHDQMYKLADFGLSTDVPDFENSKMTIGCGTPLYMSPELLQQKPYTSKCDVFSMGIIYFELLYGKTPWTANTMQQLVANVCSKPVQFPSNVQVSEESKRFIKKCLEKGEAKRYSWTQLLNDPLFKKSAGDLHYSKIVTLSIDNKTFVMKIQDIIQKKNINLKQLFAQFDKDQHGQLDINEFIKLVSTIDAGFSNESTKKLFIEIDTGKEGQISYKEFKKFIIETDHGEEKENLMMVELRNKKILRNLYDLVIKHNLDVSEIFQNFDTSGDQQLDQVEFGKILKIIQADITDKEVYYAFKKFDSDGSGSVSLQEFIVQMKKGVEALGGNLSFKKDIQKSHLSAQGQVICRKLNKAVTQNSIDVKSLFQTFDKDKSGTLDFKEFQYMIKIIDSFISEAQAKEVFQAFDPDGSGTLEFNEFFKVFQ